jgi:hypothetical protein
VRRAASGFQLQSNQEIALSAAFLVQAPSGRLDFDEFPRELAKRRLEVEFYFRSNFWFHGPDVFGERDLYQGPESSFRE